MNNFIFKDSENKTWYRTFGHWVCCNCYNRWNSAFTWISIEKYNKKLRFSRKNKDYLQQACKLCHNKNNKLIKHKIYIKDETKKLPHQSKLCFKCQKGDLCGF